MQQRRPPGQRLGQRIAQLRLVAAGQDPSPGPVDWIDINLQVAQQFRNALDLIQHGTIWVLGQEGSG